MGLHTVRLFDQELRRLRLIIVRMGGLAEQQLTDAMNAIAARDGSSADRAIRSDEEVDELEREVEQQVIRLLAVRQPMADDLRAIVAALKIATGLERIADYAKSIAKRATSLSELPIVQPVYSVPSMGKAAMSMLKIVLDAYGDNDATKALGVWNSDEMLDDLFESLFRELLTYMMEDARNITPCTHLLFIAKNLERIGDHCTNIAENVYFCATGYPPDGERPKGGKLALLR